MYRTQGEHANHYTTDAEGSLHITLCILKNTQITFVLFVQRKPIAENIPIRLLLLKFEMNSESCLVMMVSFIIYYIYTVQINNKLLFQNSTNIDEPGIVTDTTQKMTKSSSLTSIPTSEPDRVIVDQSDIITLTQDVKCFSDGLNRLKTVFEDHGMIQYCFLFYY
jgi:hypothetical protein